MPDKLIDPLSRIKPARIGVCLTGDLFGHWVDPEQYIDTYLVDKCITGAYPQQKLVDIVKTVVRWSPQHQFYFLTKRPDRIIAWGEWPENAWLGATVCNQKQFVDSAIAMRDVKAAHKWISFEPLMESINGGECEGKRLSILKLIGLSWIVIGGWSGGKNPPNIQWVREIEVAADKARIPVFHKNNLKPLLGTLRQELPSANIRS